MHTLNDKPYVILGYVMKNRIKLRVDNLNSYMNIYYLKI